MKKADKLFVNDVVEFLNDANGHAPTKKSVKILFNCLDYNDMGFRFAICKINKIVYVLPQKKRYMIHASWNINRK